MNYITKSMNILLKIYIASLEKYFSLCYNNLGEYMNLLVEIFLVFFKIGLFSFGGGYAMMPLFEKEIINGLHWISYSDFIDIVAIAQTTPGPFAVNSATFIGNKLAGFWGSVVATLGVTLPSFIIMSIIFLTINKFRDSNAIKVSIRGIRPVVLALVLAAVVTIGKGAIIDYKSIIIAIVAFILVRVKKLNPILLMAVGFLVGIVLYR